MFLKSSTWGFAVSVLHATHPLRKAYKFQLHSILDSILLQSRQFLVKIWWDHIIKFLASICKYVTLAYILRYLKRVKSTLSASSSKHCSTFCLVLALHSRNVHPCSFARPIPSSLLTTPSDSWNHTQIEQECQPIGEASLCPFFPSNCIAWMKFQYYLYMDVAGSVGLSAKVRRIKNEFYLNRSENFIRRYISPPCDYTIEQRIKTYYINFISNKHLHTVFICAVEVNFFSPHIW